MHYYRFYLFVSSNGNIGVLRGTCICITVALPKPFAEDCSEDLRLLAVIVQKDTKLKNRTESIRLRITEFKKIPEKNFKNKKITITINDDEWL